VYGPEKYFPVFHPHLDLRQIKRHGARVLSALLATLRQRVQALEGLLSQASLGLLIGQACDPDPATYHLDALNTSIAVQIKAKGEGW
jgi:hypothetical protein